jgi:hypothetical protein
MEPQNPKSLEAENQTPLTPEEAVELLRAIRRRIPQYVQLPSQESQAIRRVAHINPAFLDESINTAGASATVEGALGRTAQSLRQEADETARWSAFEAELRATHKGVTAANLVRRHRLGLAALQTYNITRQLVRQKEHADLLPHLQAMSRLNKFGRRRPTVPVEPAPAPPPPPDTAKPASS